MQEQHHASTIGLSFDVRVAAQSYSNVAGVLAGFAFSAVILIVQLNDVNNQTAANSDFQNVATIGFLTSFFGCIVSAFVFSVISGEGILTPRANHMALFGGAGFSAVINLLFWSLAAVLKAFFVNDAALLAQQILTLFVFVPPAFVSTGVLDNIPIYDLRKPFVSEFATVLLPCYVPLAVCLMLKLFGLYVSPKSGDVYFAILIWSSMASIITNGILAVLFSYTGDTYRLSLRASGAWLGLNSILSGLLILSI